MSRDTKLEIFLNKLTDPRSELSGNSICPYLKKYSSSVRYAHVNDLNQIIDCNNSIVEDMQNDPGSAFIYIIKKDVTYEEIVQLYVNEQKKYKTKDIEFLFLLKDDKTIPPLKILGNYSYPYNTLFILQRHSTLKNARNELAKNTNYYDFWSRK